MIDRFVHFNAALFALGIAAAAPAPKAVGQELADYFGFDGLEVIRIDRGAGPIALGDVNGDGLLDLIAINNFKSRIEIHYQRRDVSPDDLDSAPISAGPNQIPEHWRFRRQTINVSHRIGAIVAHDYDGDGLLDLVYAGIPAEIVFLRQVEPGVFRVDRRHRINNLQPSKDSLRIADVVGDDEPELITIAGGEIVIHSMVGSTIDRLYALSGSQPFVGVWIDDLTGNGRNDIVGVIPDDPAPLRIWLTEEQAGLGALGPQLRFEMPALIECDTLRIAEDEPARLVVIERVSRRVVVLEMTREMMEAAGDRDASIRVFGFTDPGNRERDIAVHDIDGDGLLDLVATDTRANAVAAYRQAAGRGLQRGVTHPSLADIRVVAVAETGPGGRAELFALSEREGVIGRSSIDSHSVGYPVPVRIPDGRTPVAMNVVDLDGSMTLAAILRDGREYEAALIPLNGDAAAVDTGIAEDATDVQRIALGAQSRSPDTIIAVDADQSGHTDLLLLTRDRPMLMLAARVDEEGRVRHELIESRQMGQFGLVQSASDRNIAVYDIDGDGHEELLIADRNFIRAVRFVSNAPPGVSPGWQVVAQINARAADAKLASLATFDDRIIAADTQHNRLVVFMRETAESNEWRERESVHVAGFKFEEIIPGSFSGDDADDILAIGEDGFAIIRLAGERRALREVGVWRTDDERRRHHEVGVGDVNGDGFVDLLVLDAAQQMLEVLSFTEAQNLLYATSFQVFESRIFSGGEPREFEPSRCLIGDLTGDGADDLILLCHDRVLLYPQATADE